MAFFIVYDNASGTSTARPIRRWGEVADSTEAALQVIDANDVVYQPANLTIFETYSFDPDNLTTHAFTFNTSTNAITAVTPTANTDAAEARALFRLKVLLDESHQFMTGERKISNTRRNDWQAYRDLLRAVPAQGGFPTTITWPTAPSTVDDDTVIDFSNIYRRLNILGTVGFNAFSIPNGAIMQRGSNGNGDYVRWADGTQLCYNDALTVGAPNNAAGSVFVTNDATWTYPAAFTAIGALSGNMNSTFCWLGRGSGAIGNSTASVVGMRHATSGTSLSARVMAVGRWD